MKNKYYELDKKMTKNVNRELRKEGHNSYPVVCDECHGQGCNSCDDGKKEITIE